MVETAFKLMLFGSRIKGHAAAAAKSLQSCPTQCDPHRRQHTRLHRPWDSPGKNTGVDCHFLQCMKVKSESEVAQSYSTLCDPMDCSLPGSSVHGIFQARVLEWVAISFLQGILRLKDQTWISCLAGGFFSAEPPGKTSNKE